MKLFHDLFANRDPVAGDQQATLDHIEVGTGKKDWRKALKKAALRHGKPFKAAPAHLDREVWKDGEFRRVKGGEKAPEPERKIIAAVEPIRKQGAK